MEVSPRTHGCKTSFPRMALTCVKTFADTCCRLVSNKKRRASFCLSIHGKAPCRMHLFPSGWDERSQNVRGRSHIKVMVRWPVRLMFLLVTMQEKIVFCFCLACDAHQEKRGTPSKVLSSLGICLSSLEGSTSECCPCGRSTGALYEADTQCTTDGSTRIVMLAVSGMQEVEK